MRPTWTTSGFCKQAFPSIPDLAIAKMVAGVEVDLFRPNEELKALAQKAIDLGIARAFDDPDNVVLAGEAGAEFQRAWDAAADPWFNFTSGNGFYHFDEIWRDNPAVPYAFIRDYIARIEAGEDISRPIEAIRAERDRIVEEYRDLLGTTRTARRSTPSWGWPGWCSPTWRTTTSTSSTGPCRRPGAR